MVQSIDRAMQIIHILSSKNEKSAWSVSEIAAACRLPASSAHRLLQALMNHKLVTKAADGRGYRLGTLWMELGFWMHERLDVRKMARPVMEKLAREVRQSVYLSVPNGTHAVIIDRVNSPESVRVIDNLGERISMNVGAANRVMLAFMERDRQERILSALSEDDVKKKEWFAISETIRQKGYAMSFAEKTPGTASIAAPVFNYENEVVAALYINFIMNGSHENQEHSIWKEKVKAAAAETSGAAALE